MENHQEKIGFGSALIIAINAMVGAGVLAMPAVLARNVGPACIFSFLLSVFAVLCIGLSLGRVAHIYPGDGWNYRYPSQWAGHLVGMYSAFSYIVAVIIAMGFLVQQAGCWVHNLIPYLFTQQQWGIGVLLVLTFLVLAGTEVAATGQYVIAVFVLAPLLYTSFICWQHIQPAYFSPFMPEGFSSVFNALPHALFGLIGFECVASLSSVVENPSKTVPRVFVTAIICVGILYLVFVCGILFAIPKQFLTDDLNHTLAAVLQTVFPMHRFFSQLVLVGGTFAIIGTLHSMIWSVSSLLMDIVKKVRFSGMRLMVHHGWWNRMASVIIAASGMLLISLIAPPRWLMPLTALFVVPSYLFSIMPLLFIRHEWYSGRNLVTLAGLVSGGLIFYFALQATLLSLT